MSSCTTNAVSYRYLTNDVDFTLKPVSDYSSPSLSAPSSRRRNPERKRIHVCQTCGKAFTTSGHLARHLRIHTGERKHACPFPNCGMRCSRKDNLKQHYRTHLNTTRKPPKRSEGGRPRRGSKPSLEMIIALSTNQQSRLYTIPPATPPPLEVASLATSTPSSDQAPTSPLSPYPDTDRHLSSSPLSYHYMSRSCYVPPSDSMPYPGTFNETAGPFHHPSLPPIDTTFQHHNSEESPLPSRHFVPHVSPTYSHTSHYSTYNIRSSSDPTSSPPTSYSPYQPCLDEESPSYSHYHPFTNNRVYISSSPSGSYSSASTDSLHIPTSCQSPPPVLAPSSEVYRRDCRSLDALGNGYYAVQTGQGHSHILFT